MHKTHNNKNELIEILKLIKEEHFTITIIKNLNRVFKNFINNNFTINDRPNYNFCVDIDGIIKEEDADKLANYLKKLK